MIYNKIYVKLHNVFEDHSGSCLWGKLAESNIFIMATSYWWYI